MPPNTANGEVLGGSSSDMVSSKVGPKATASGSDPTASDGLLPAVPPKSLATMGVGVAAARSAVTPVVDCTEKYGHLAGAAPGAPASSPRAKGAEATPLAPGEDISRPDGGREVQWASDHSIPPARQEPYALGRAEVGHDSPVKSCAAQVALAHSHYRARVAEAERVGDAEIARAEEACAAEVALAGTVRDAVIACVCAVRDAIVISACDSGPGSNGTERVVGTAVAPLTSANDGGGRLSPPGSFSSARVMESPLRVVGCGISQREAAEGGAVVLPKCAAAGERVRPEEEQEQAKHNSATKRARREALLNHTRISLEINHLLARSVPGPEHMNRGDDEMSKVYMAGE